MTIEDKIIDQNQIRLKMNKPFFVDKKLTLNHFFSLSFQSGLGSLPNYSIRNTSNKEIIIKINFSVSESINITLKMENLGIFFDSDRMLLSKINSESVFCYSYEKKFVIPILFEMERIAIIDEAQASEAYALEQKGFRVLKVNADVVKFEVGGKTNTIVSWLSCFFTK